MPRYFLHHRKGDDLIKDHDGCVLPDLAAANREALAEARELLAEYVRAGKVLDGQYFDITDEDGRVLMTVRLVDALVFSSKPHLPG